MSNISQSFASYIVDYDKYSINENFHLIWWPVKKKYVKKLHADAKQAVIVYDYQSNEAYVQILPKDSTDDNGIRIEYDFTEEDMEFMEDAAEDMGLFSFVLDSDFKAED